MSNSDYAKSVFVSTNWMEDHLNKFQNDDPVYRLVEMDMDTEVYDESHAPGATGFNQEFQLQDQTTRDMLTKEDSEGLLDPHGIPEDPTIALYGGNFN